MPFKVKYQIYEVGKQEPSLTTYNKTEAYMELDEKKREVGYMNAIMDYEVIPDGLTKQEEYVWLVYRVRQAIYKYYAERKHVTKEKSNDNLKVSLALESELDKWNARTRFYLQGHPKASHGNEAAFAFFEVVEEWRKCWHKYFAYKRLKDKDESVEQEMKKQCFAYEKEIDKYVKLVIGL